MLYHEKKVSGTYAGKELVIETGKLAKQANGSVVVRYGNTVILATACAAKQVDAKLDFFPLTVDFAEKFYSVGKIPGGFIKREAKPSEWATLTARIIDRPLRPSFPKDYRNTTQIVVTTLATDATHPIEVAAGIAASAALMVSDIPFNGPVGFVKIGYVKDQIIINPTTEEMKNSKMDLLLAGSKDAILMVEGECDQLPEELILDAIFKGFDAIQEVIKIQNDLQSLSGKAKFAVPAKSENVEITNKVKEFVWPRFKEAFNISEKLKRYEKLDEIHTNLLSEMNTLFANVPNLPEIIKTVENCYDDCKKQYARTHTLDTATRIDGRKFEEIREIMCETGVLPGVHGSALFTRGETQALVVVTLGTAEDVQRIENLQSLASKNFMLHYNFPPYSVGETGRMGAPGRREVGHGNLAERALKMAMPSFEKFPYTTRVVSEILESNGSSSMASVCGGSMALMDAGVSLAEPVAGIAMGLMMEENKVAVLSDILGDEDHLGDMDFKVTGTQKGVTALQMDIKIAGLNKDIFKKALLQARDGRIHILGEMSKAITENKKELAPNAPRFEIFQIKKEKIKDVIGPGGKNIKYIVETCGVKVNVTDDGKVSVYANSGDSIKKAWNMISALVDEPEVGQVYTGKVKSITDFGAFVEILPGLQGLLHISEIDNVRIKAVSDVLKVDDTVSVKLLEIDRSGRMKLSRRALLK